MRPQRAVHVLVTGRVQGVFFRQSTKEQADRLGLCGWVRNLLDGRVEAHVEGDSVAVSRLLHWMEKGGPPAASVTEVVVEPGEPGHPEGFAVRR
ncbi:MAG: acylphosphatase [Acidobacteriota bacterium]